MKSLCSSLLSPLLLCVISAGVAACSGNPKDNAMTACAASFSKSETAEDDDGDSVKVFAEGEESKLAACKQGVTWGDQNLYQANAKTVPPLNTFRSSYQSTKAYCNAFPSDGERMACLDGLDGYTGLLADSANYQWRDNHNDDRSLTDDYFVNRSYYEVYDDRSWDDDLWLYYLMHRLSYPEYYPG